MQFLRGNKGDRNYNGRRKITISKGDPKDVKLKGNPRLVPVFIPTHQELAWLDSRQHDAKLKNKQKKREAAFADKAIAVSIVSRNVETEKQCVRVATHPPVSDTIKTPLVRTCWVGRWGRAHCMPLL
jgi:hypothetical protein